MEKIIDFIIFQANAEKVGSALLVLAILYLFKKEPFRIFTHFVEQAKSDLHFAKELLASEKLSEEANTFIREKIELVTFKRFYGISANAKLRKYLLNFYDQHYPTINWVDLKRARQYYNFDGEKIVVSISRWDEFSSGFVRVLFTLIFIIAVLILVGAYILLMFFDLSGKEFYSFVFLGCSLIASSAIFSSANWPYISAKKLDNLLNGPPPVSI